MATTEEKVRVTADGDEPVEEGEEQVEQTEPEPEPDDGDEEGEEETPAESKGRKVKSPQEKFQTAFAAFVRKAAECFEITPADVQVAPHPGVVGIMLPGFAEPRTHENFKTCSTCNGLGKVLTGAVTGDAAKDWHICPDTRCKGNGFWQKNVTQPQAPTTGPLAVQSVASPDGEFGEAPAWMGDPSLTPGQ